MNAINNNVLRALQFEAGSVNAVDNITVNVGQVQTLYTWPLVETAILQDSSILFVNGRAEVSALGMQGWPQHEEGKAEIHVSVKVSIGSMGPIKRVRSNLRFFPHAFTLKIKMEW